MSTHQDLNQLLNAFRMWKPSCFPVGEQKNMKLERQEKAQEQLVKRENGEKTIKEIRELENIISICKALQTTLSRFNRYEDENKILLDKVSVMERYQEELRKRLIEEEEKMTHADAEIQLKTKLEQLLLGEKEKLIKEVKEKDEELKLVKSQLSLGKKASEENMMLRIEYEEKITKLQEQLIKLGNIPYQAANPTSNLRDIFRKKLQHLQEQHDIEVAYLTDKIAKLERELSNVTTMVPESPTSTPSKRCRTNS